MGKKGRPSRGRDVNERGERGETKVRLKGEGGRGRAWRERGGRGGEGRERC